MSKVIDNITVGRLKPAELWLKASGVAIALYHGHFSTGIVWQNHNRPAEAIFAVDTYLEPTSPRHVEWEPFKSSTMPVEKCPLHRNNTGVEIPRQLWELKQSLLNEVRRALAAVKFETLVLSTL